jgi:hypothetical protein
VQKEVIFESLTFSLTSLYIFCHHDSLHLALKFQAAIYEMVTLKEMNKLFATSRPFFKEKQSAKNSSQQCPNVLNHLVQ